MSWKKAEEFGIILKYVRKEVNGFTIRETSTTPVKNGVNQESNVEFSVWHDIPKVTRSGSFLSYGHDEKEIKSGFKTLEDAISMAETLTIGR